MLSLEPNAGQDLTTLELKPRVLGWTIGHSSAPQFLKTKKLRGAVSRRDRGGKKESVSCPQILNSVYFLQYATRPVLESAIEVQSWEWPFIARAGWRPARTIFPRTQIILHDSCALRLASSPPWALLSSSGEGNVFDKGLLPVSCDSKQPVGSGNWPTPRFAGHLQLVLNPSLVVLVFLLFPVGQYVLLFSQPSQGAFSEGKWAWHWPSRDQFKK